MKQREVVVLKANGAKRVMIWLNHTWDAELLFFNLFIACLYYFIYNSRWQIYLIELFNINLPTAPTSE